MGGAPAVALAASTPRAIGAIIALIAVVGFVVYLVINIVQGRREAGAELEIAANRKPYLPDEELEGRKLDRTLGIGLITLGIVAVGLPLYWLNEPARQENALAGGEETFAHRGEELFATTAEGGFNCAGCHGEAGVGGIAPYTLTDDAGEFVATVTWRAPALDTALLRYTRDELTYVLVYGRPFSPMPAWGVEGGGPMNEQQIKNLVDYIASIQISSEDAKQSAAEELAKTLGLFTDEDLEGKDAEEQQAIIDSAVEEIDYDDLATGEALFNLGKDTGFAGGAYACGRCHTRGWSIVVNPTGDNPSPNPSDADISAFVDFPPGAGAMGPSLRTNLIPRQFLTVAEMVEFITLGSEDGLRYGQNGQGSGRMPGFGDDPNTAGAVDDGMLTPEMICAIVRYEASLETGEPPDGPCVEPEATTTTTTEDEAA
jgi:mono/diheme cytochrome c family protein